ncbi:MAG: YdeI/OmpD-associated family protein [Bacteroidota bacterium]
MAKKVSMMRRLSNPVARFISTLERSNNKLWGAHFAVSLKNAALLIQGTSRRVVCSINGSPERQCALIPDGKGAYVITVNKGLRDSMGLSFGARLDITLRLDDSKYGLPMPRELQEVFRQDKAAEKRFHTLTPGKQRTLLYIINSGKTMPDRVFRAVTIVRHLEENSGVINYRKLGVMLRKSTTKFKKDTL